jgi:hypothetical protein
MNKDRIRGIGASKNTATPIVFLSSVFGGFLRQRQKLRAIIADEFGFECLAYESESERFGGAPRPACLQAVDSSDLYVGVFWKRAGTIVPTDNLTLTELEYYRARKNRKLMRVYVLEADASQVELDLKLFLETIGQPDNGICIEFCKDFARLQSVLRRDLEYFGKCWSQGKTPPWQPSFLTNRILKHLQCLLTYADLYRLPADYVNHHKLWTDREYLRQQVIAMQYHYSRCEFLRCGEIGSQLLVAFLTQHSKVSINRIPPLWVDFLTMWAGTCTWLNILNVPYGGVEAARLVGEIHEAKEDWPSHHSNASILSNTCYVEACSLADEQQKLAMLPSRSFRREQRDMRKLQWDLERRRQDRLKKALNYYKLFMARFRPRYLNLYRAYIYQVQGNYDQAISDFSDMAMDRRYGSNELSYLDVIADLGTTKILKAKRDELSRSSKRNLISEGMFLLNEAHQRVQQYSSYPTLPTYLIIEKEYAKGLLNSGQPQAAADLLTSLYMLARREGLSQQAESIRILLSRSLSAEV